jgi:tRNA dimethylallyltransferase
MATNTKSLIVIVGPTAVGKTAIAIEVARHFRTEIISADSRQFYREMSIGTAKPTPNELADVPHHFINNLSIHDEYTAGMYEREALAVLDQIFRKHNVAVMVGGSGLFIRAVCEGFDSFKGEEVTDEVKEKIRLLSLEQMQQEVSKLDPEYFDKVDKQNPRRLQRALEVIYGTGRKYSDQRTGAVAKRNFNIVKIGLELPREVLYDRINKRVDAMRKAGLWEEAIALYPYKNLQTLQTVGYQEVFDCIDGKLSKSEAIDKIKQNSRNYAKRQMTWFKKDESIKWFDANKGLLSILREI